MIDRLVHPIRKPMFDLRHRKLCERYSEILDRHKSELTLISGGELSLLEGRAPIVIFCCRDESLRLPYFLQYYRDLGFEGFIAIDNLSSDGTRELLLEQRDVVLYEANGSYAAAGCGLYWVNHILREEVANGRWILLVDVDELLVFRGVEDNGIDCLIAEAEASRDRVVFTPMIDMYSCLGLDQVDYRAGENFLDACGYYDGAGGYRVKRRTYGYDLEGGVRNRVFYNSSVEDSGPILKKYSLVKWDKSYLFNSAHSVSPLYLRRTNTIAALLHFKFFQDFRKKVDVAVRDDLHWGGSREYKVYRDALCESGSLSLCNDESTRYTGSESLRWLFDFQKT